MKKIILIKLGGSLISDKTKVNAAKFEVIDDLSKQIKKILNERKDLSLILATGAGGFGHPLAKRYEKDLTRGLGPMKAAVKKLNRIVVASLRNKKVRAISVEPAKVVRYKKMEMTHLLKNQIIKLLNKNTVPIFNADLIEDEDLGWSILSMDKFIVDMALELKKKRLIVDKVIFCGTTNGVIDDKRQTIKKIDGESASRIERYFFQNKIIDVSGGMKQKVKECLRLIDKKIPAFIINGQEENGLYRVVIKNQVEGTVIRE